MEILKVHNLCKAYGKGGTKADTLKNVSFLLENEEFAAVVGDQQTILMITHNNNLTASADRVFHVSAGVLTDLGGKENEKLS